MIFKEEYDFKKFKFHCKNLFISIKYGSIYQLLRKKEKTKDQYYHEIFWIKILTAHTTLDTKELQTQREKLNNKN